MGVEVGLTGKGITVVRSKWDLIQGDMRDLIMHPQIDLLLTDVPNLPEMPYSEIERGLNKFNPKKAVICCKEDQELKLDYKYIRFSHDDYRVHPLYFTCSNIFLHTDEEDLVFDPFCGYSTTGICALDMNRRYYGVEINPEIYQISDRRLKELDGYISS